MRPCTLPIWLSLSGLHWEPLKLWLEQHGREASELTLVIHRTGSPAEPGMTVSPWCCRRVRGARLALLLDHAQHLPF